MEQALFAPLLGQQFLLRPPEGGEPVSVALVEARLLGPARAPGQRPPFALLFRAAAGGPVLPQRTYRVSHPALPLMDIFLGPVATAGEGVGYEAVFN